MTHPDKLFSQIDQIPPPCPACGQPAGALHNIGCAALAAMRAQAYPEVLEQNGLPWYANTIARLTEEIEELKKCPPKLICERCGVLTEVTSNKPTDLCDECHGEGRVTTDTATCISCNGSGKRTKTTD